MVEAGRPAPAFTLVSAGDETVSLNVRAGTPFVLCFLSEGGYTPRRRRRWPIV